MGARFRSWWQKIKRHPVSTVLISLLAVIIVLVILGGYKFNWDWTGFNRPSKTLWDWLQLLGVLAVPVVVGFGAVWFTTRQGKVADAENKDNQRETVLQAYIDKISELLLEKKLRDSAEEDEVRKIARVRTITILFQLDARRIGYVFAFLREAGLMSAKSDESIVSLSQADLREINLSGAHLEGANFSGAYLSGADLREANLSGVNLSGAYLYRATFSYQADLREANLSGAHLSGADLSGAYLRKANLMEADLHLANLRNAIFSEADLTGVSLTGANLSGADLSEANLSEANLSGADLSGAYLSGANLSGADLGEPNLGGAHFYYRGLQRSEANLREADLTGVNLLGAKVTEEQLKEAESLQGAIMPDGSRHP